MSGKKKSMFLNNRNKWSTLNWKLDRSRTSRNWEKAHTVMTPLIVVKVLLTVAGDATSRSMDSKMRLICGDIWMISPLIRHNFLLSSSTVFIFSIHTASTGPSKISHFLSGLWETQEIGWLTPQKNMPSTNCGHEQSLGLTTRVMCGLINLHWFQWTKR